MDIVYVIYYNGEMYKNSRRKTAYLEEKYAKQVISAESKIIVQNSYKISNIDYWDLDKEDRKKLIQKEKEKFEIRKFVEL